MGLFQVGLFLLMLIILAPFAAIYVFNFTLIPIGSTNGIDFRIWIIASLCKRRVRAIYLV